MIDLDSGSDRPNIIVFISDTFRRDHLGAYGNDDISTPHLDKLASQSMVFDNHTVGSFPTVPARADFLTGRMSATFMGWEPLRKDIPVLPALMAEAGYMTMGVVDVPFYVRDGFGMDRGFRDFIWVRGQGDVHRAEERADVRSLWVKESDRMCAQTMLAAEEWLDRRYKDPFMLWIDTWDPHEPWDAPEYYTGKYDAEKAGEKAPWPVYGKWEEKGSSRDIVDHAHAAYCGEISLVDRWIGRVLEKIDLLGIADNTYVFFVSDHGFYFGEHEYFGKGDWFEPDPEQGLTREEVSKSEQWMDTLQWSPLYQELTRVPLMIRGPGISPGRTSALTTSTDLAPTILDLAGAASEPGMHGSSLKPALMNGAEHRDFVVSTWPLNLSKGGITKAIDSKAREVAVDLPVTVTTRDSTVLISGPDSPPEFYDLRKDPSERTNVWSDRTDEGTALASAAVDYLTSIGTNPAFLQPRTEALKKFGSTD